MQSSCRNDGSFSVLCEQSHKKRMEDTRGKYGDTMEFRYERLKTQLRVETYWFFYPFTLSMKAVAVFAENE